MTNTVEVPVTLPTTPESGMSLEQARRTLWLDENPRPMGELVDSGFLTTEKLAWVTRGTGTLRLQAAAKVLLRHMQRSLLIPAPEIRPAASTEAAPVH